MARTRLILNEKVWTKIYENVTSGGIILPPDSGAFGFVQTTRDWAPSGVVDPMDDDETDGGLAVPLFEKGRRENVDNNVGTNVYIYPKNADDDASDTVGLLIEP